MGTAREVSTWQDISTAGNASGGWGWLAVVAIVLVLFGGLVLLVDGTARAPTTFEDVSQLTQAP